MTPASRNMLLSASVPPSLQCQFSVKSLIFDAITGLHKQISVPSKLSQSMINLVFIPWQPFKQHRGPQSQSKAESETKLAAPKS